MAEDGNGEGKVMFSGRITARELFYIVGVVAGFVANWFTLKADIRANVDSVAALALRSSDAIAALSRRLDEHQAITEVGQNVRIDRLTDSLAQHIGSDGHRVALQRTSELERRVELLEQHVTEEQRERLLPPRGKRLSLLAGDGMNARAP